MSEKIYALLLRVPAPHFQQAYGNEALQLFRDRSRDEQGFTAKLRLWVDLLGDLTVCVTRDRRLVHPTVAGPPLRAFDDMPSFHTVDGGLPRAPALFLGAVYSLVVLEVVPLLISHGEYKGPARILMGSSQGSKPRTLATTPKQFDLQTAPRNPAVLALDVSLTDSRLPDRSPLAENWDSA